MITDLVHSLLNQGRVVSDEDTEWIFWREGCFLGRTHMRQRKNASDISVLVLSSIAASNPLRRSGAVFKKYRYRRASRTVLGWRTQRASDGE